MDVAILHVKMLGLLDSGASRTIIGIKGWSVLESLGLPWTEEKPISCTVANGEKCLSQGSVRVPFELQGKVRILSVLVVTSLPHT